MRSNILFWLFDIYFYIKNIVRFMYNGLKSIFRLCLLILLALFLRFRINILNLFEFYFIVFVDIRIKSIFYLILRSSRQMLADLRPFATNFAIQLQYLSILLFSPILFFNLWIQFINKPFSDLLPILSS
jgi:hypothetical protein